MPFEPVAGHAERFDAKGGRVWKCVKDTEATFYTTALLLIQNLSSKCYETSTVDDRAVAELCANVGQEYDLHSLECLQSLARHFTDEAYPRLLQPLLGTAIKHCALKHDGDPRQQQRVSIALNPQWWLTSNHAIDFLQLLQFIPRCFDIQLREATNENVPRPFEVVLEDLSAHCQTACVMDIKMGIQYEAPWTKPDRIAELQNKAQACSSASLGVRVTGMRGCSADGVKDIIGRQEGYTIKSYDDVKRAIMRYIDLCEASNRVALVCYFLEELAKIRTWQQKQNLCQLRQSSILFVFDGCEQPPDENVPYALAGVHDDSNNNRGVCGATVRLIDFTYVIYKGSEMKDEDLTDPGYMHGLTSLIKVLSDILELEV